MYKIFAFYWATGNSKFKSTTLHKGFLRWLIAAMRKKIYLEILR